MLVIKSTSANDAWSTTLKTVSNQGEATGNEKYYRDEVVLIEVASPAIEHADSRFPMAQSDIDIINRYIFTGEQEEAVIHDWTKLYYH